MLGTRNEIAQQLETHLCELAANDEKELLRVYEYLCNFIKRQQLLRLEQKLEEQRTILRMDKQSKTEIESLTKAICRLSSEMHNSIRNKTAVISPECLQAAFRHFKFSCSKVKYRKILQSFISPI